MGKKILGYVAADLTKLINKDSLRINKIDI